MAAIEDNPCLPMYWLNRNNKLVYIKSNDILASSVVSH